MKNVVFSAVILFLCSNLFAGAQESPLKGTWRLVSYDYILPDGNEENLEIIKAVRVYNDSYFSVFWEYRDSTTETCVAQYRVEGEKLKLKILAHTNLPIVGREISGISKIVNHKLFHFVDIDGYIIMEIYEPLEKEQVEKVPLKPEAWNLHLMGTELLKYGKQKNNPKLVEWGEKLIKQAIALDPTFTHTSY